LDTVDLTLFARIQPALDGIITFCFHAGQGAQPSLALEKTR
jgi:hypothetical protein